ncbi:cell division protein FtsK [Streptococcus anginosus]|uniref:cell division protein FtsK n=1 Tax=Streptococcus anginosus TaxID=1328 RepID=UPI000D089EA8|nr:cell division protein FtsK [Streptococcus anginosus]PRT78650.1 cell division protein FtsK [Streptococcus anginosus]
MRKYRRIKRQANSKLQSYQRSLIALAVTILCYIVCLTIINANNFLSKLFILPSKFFFFAILVAIITSILSWKNREEVSKLKIKSMSKQAYKLARKIHRLFNDKQITDVLKLSNSTRYGDEMPEVAVFIEENLNEGFIAIENIANYDRADREKFEQRISGLLAGKHQRFAVVSSELTAGDSFIIFYFEDTLTSQRLYVKDESDSLKDFINDNKHAIHLSKELVWYSDITAHLSIIARTRAGKSILAGRYMARLMLLQDWMVEYNSAKYDRYVKEFNGQSDPIKIVERAEYWCSVMDKRLAEINDAGKEKYLEMENMPDIGLFFDELGNLNASLESLDKVDKSLKLTSRWTTAINRLSATGGSAGIHIIAISQFATKEGFLPSLARVNCSDAVIMLGGAADSADERKYLMSGFADMPKRSYGKGQGLARIVGSGRKWENEPHFFETPWFED